MITTPARLLFREGPLLFREGPYQNVRYIFWDPRDPPLNVKLVAERPPGVVLVGKVFNIPSKCKLTCSRPPSKTHEKTSLHFGYVPHLKAVLTIDVYVGSICFNVKLDKHHHLFHLKQHAGRNLSLQDVVLD